MANSAKPRLGCQGPSARVKVLRSLPYPIRLTDKVIERFTIEKEGPVRVVWAPFGHVPRRSVLVLVGITPGRFQAEKAFNTFRAALDCGLETDAAFERVRVTAGFSGPLRANLVAMLDHIGLQQRLGFRSCAELFESMGEPPVYFTSALHYPVFVDGDN